LLFDKKDIPFHMINCPKRVMDYVVPGCDEVTRQSEVVPHKWENVAKHSEFYVMEGRFDFGGPQ